MFKVIFAILDGIIDIILPVGIFVGVVGVIYLIGHKTGLRLFFETHDYLAPLIGLISFWAIIIIVGVVSLS